jgi:uncharacterized protein (TIRG00374 family)
MAEKLRSTRAFVVLGFALGQAGIHFLRVLRWMLYLRAIDPSVSRRAVFAAANIGIPATFFVPLRLGEFVRPMLINRAGIRFGSAVASVVVERLADGLCAVGMFFLFFSFVSESTPLPEENIADLKTASRWAAVAFGTGLVFLVAAALAREPVLGASRFVLSKLSATLADRLLGLVSTFLDGLAALGSTWRAATYIVLTVAYWAGNALLTWWLAASYEPSLPVLSGFIVISALVFAISVPAGPAFAGTFEAGFTVGLGVFAVSASTAGVIAVVAHVVQILTMAGFVLMGFLAAEPGQRLRASSPGSTAPEAEG